VDIVLNILLWIHLVALVGGGASAVAMPAIAGQMPTASPDARAALGKVAKRLTMAGRGAVAVLLITGPLMFWLRWNFTPASQMWFGIKMLFVLAIVVSMIVSGINAKKAMQGDAGAQRIMQLSGMITGGSLLVVVLAAVFAFH
jgi:uncharacterized membrane protein